jgi:hypothetical protein
MSEYQYYEFQAIDRPLTPEEQAEVGSLSSRTHPTPTHAVFTYSYSDFRGDPIRVLAAYYDAMLYMANWGSRRLAFRLPRSVIHPDRLAPYCIGDLVSTSTHGDHVILDINFYEIDMGDWIEGEGWLPALAPLRRDLLRSDFRALYLIWLKAALLEVEYEIEVDALEPPVPAGLRDLSAPLRDFVDFFAIDDDQLAVAAEASPRATPTAEPDLEALIPKLSEEERNAFLLRVAQGEPNVDLQLVRRLEDLAGEGQASHTAAAPRRTVGALLQAVEDQARQRKERKRKKAEKARLQRLDELARAEPHLWEDVLSLIEETKGKAYDEAVKILVELRSLAEHQAEQARFGERVRHIAEQYSNRPALQRRLRWAGLVADDH